MGTKKKFQQALLLFYLFITLTAFPYTLLRVKVPYLWPLTWWSFSMMAPFQGYDTHTGTIVAEGKNVDGSWETIDLDKYHPLRKPDQQKMRRLAMYLNWGEEIAKEKYALMAQLILTREPYQAVRLKWEIWPMSTEGHDALRVPEHITEFPLAEVP